MRRVVLLMNSLSMAACASMSSNGAALMEADREFARQSAAHGAPAWSAVMAPNAIKPGPGSTWIIGPAAIGEQMTAAFARPGFSLAWEPTRAEISRGGNLGYTWGRWTSTGGGNTRHGNYMTVWEKQPGGVWKVLFDTGDPDPPATVR